MEKIQEKFTEDIIYQWTKTWSEKDIIQSVENCKEDDVLLPYYLRYLPKNGITLECGCGLGQWVVYLNQLGYKMAGVEIVPECVQVCKKYFPDADVREGDVRQLPFPDNYFGGYISLGVFEHMIEGPESTIHEMKRVLSSGGIAIIAVPAYNYFMRFWYPLRQLMISLVRKNRMVRKLLGKPIISNPPNDFDLKYKEITNQIRPEFWAAIGTYPDKGPLFIEYKYKKNQIDRQLQSAELEIIESTPVNHPLVYQDIFGKLFLKNSSHPQKKPELNLCGRFLQKVFQGISPYFFNYIYIYVVRKK